MGSKVLPFKPPKKRRRKPETRGPAYDAKFNELMRLIGNIDLKPETVDACISAIRWHEARPTG